MVDPAVRPCTDLDLLIHRDAVLTVDALLQRLGYRRMADEHSWDFDVGFDCATVYASSRGVHVDLHWSLLSDPRFIGTSRTVGAFGTARSPCRSVTARRW